ncbi:hypothetical protein ENBRE01_2555 [Enteropsectra breve]|nr:hypothetical protein ENBRE01_2555 [Enteropsectra breve]
MAFISQETKIQLRKINFYRDIPNIIKQLENETLSTEYQMQLLNRAKELIIAGNEYIDRFGKILERNPDLKFFENLNMLSLSNKNQIYYNVPLTTVSVERSFRSYKTILNDKRRNLTIENIGKLLTLYFYKDLN